MMLHYQEQGTGPVIVLIHGMASSGHYFQPLVPYLVNKYRIISIDLLGFGQSPKPKNIIYNYQTHIQSIAETLDQLGVTEPFVLAGHSMGALLALRFTALYPRRVQRLILISIPVYSDKLSAHRAITQSSRLKEIAYYGWTSKILCNVWCKYLRPISSRLAPRYLPHLGRDSALDSLLHTWQSYSQSLHNVLEAQAVEQDMASMHVPIVLVYGDRDRYIDQHQINVLKRKFGLNVHVLPGTHHIISEQPVGVAKLIEGL